MISNSCKNFWKSYADNLSWHKFPKKIFEKDSNNKPRWFQDGEINVYYNCVARHIESGDGKKTAIYFIDSNNKISKFSYLEVSKLVDNFSYCLEKKSKSKKLKVMIHASASIDTAVAMLACVKLGLHFSLIFEELKEDALLKRLNLFKPQIYISKKPSKICKEITYLNLLSYKKNKNKNKNKIYNLKFFKSTRPLFTLFTSGSTGIPKGITHGSGGYLLYSYYTCEKFFGLDKTSKILCASDAGWINGHTYSVFGPLSIGATSIILQKPTLLFNKDILFSSLNLGVSIFYVPVTVLRIMKSIYKNISFKRNNLKTLGTMGEPLANNVGKWFVKSFGKKEMPIINTYFQTETGGIITSHKYNQKIPSKLYGYVGEPIKGHIKLNYLNSKKKEIKILSSWPGQMINVINSKKSWGKYFDNNNNFRMFDYASKKEKNIFIHGRTDDVINIRGHRIGSSEIEAVILEIDTIVECSAISVYDDLEGFVFYLFCISKTRNIDQIEKKIIKNFGTFALPKKIFFINELPKTRSGKIMRRLLRNLIESPKKKINEDISTLINKKSIIQIAKIIENS